MSMKSRPYLIYDVFTDEPLSGNPLAIVLDGEGLDDRQMQRIAGEFNLSETVFLSPPNNPLHTRRVRIFTPHHELPFAGHPTVGTAVALAESTSGEDGHSALIVLEEAIGPVRCAVSSKEGRSFGEFDLPQLPFRVGLDLMPETVAAAIGLSPHEIGFENHTIGVWSAGVPFVFIPVANLGAAAKIKLDPYLWEDLMPEVGGRRPNAYIYCREAVHHQSSFHARMFAPDLGIAEDPATGSAAAAFAGAIVDNDMPLDGIHRYWIEQGIEMGRPSRIRLEIEVEGGQIRSARIGGEAVKVAEGRIFV